MRDDEVPQDGNVTLGGHTKAVYARAADGRIRMVESVGWEVEEIVTRQAVEECDRLTAQTRALALSGQASPLHYHMHRARMDEPLLSQVSGIWEWRVRRHLRPEIFARLRPGLLQRYAEALGLTVAQLKKVD